MADPVGPDAEDGLVETDAKSRIACRLIEAYEALLADAKLGPAEVLDESVLPGPRAEIAAALLAAYHGEIKHHFSVAKIQGWLVELAQFQPDVGDPILDIAAETARRVAQARRDMRRIDAGALTREVKEDCDHKGWRKRGARFHTAVERDRSQYLNQLRG